MQPIAYSPNLQQQDDDRQSWGAGDDEDSMKPPSQRKTDTATQGGPPRLPQLYFEQNNVDQIDFAYQHSRSTSKLHSRADVNCVHDDASNQMPDGRPGNRPSPRPSPSPIDTQVPPSNSDKGGGNPANKLDQGDSNEDEEDEDGVGARGGSFYWHSPQSTENGDESPRPFDDEDGDEDEEDEEEGGEGEGEGEEPESSSKEETESKEEDNEDGHRVHEPLVIRPIISTVPENALTSASALGFGGPSDWMHFNDYDATEEVDDLALYVSNKPKTAELPASNMPKEEEANKLEASLSPRQLMAREREVLPTIQERASENLEDESKASISDQQPQSDTSSAKDSVSLTDNQSSAASQEIITAPPVLTQSKESLERHPSPTNVSIQQEAQTDSSTNSIVVQQEDVRPQEANKVPDPEPQARDETPSPQDQAQQRTSEPNSTRTRVLSNQSSQLNSPIDDDDGKEQIIISLQVPDTPAPDKTEHAKPVEEEEPRERQLSVTINNVDPKNLESPELLKSGRKSVFPQFAEMEDPYAGLDPWAKASLNRYVKMLKEEAAAETDEEKFTIFINFTHKETRNRTVLYNMEDESDMSEHPSKVETIHDKDGNLRPTTVKSKILPTTPSQNEPVPPLPAHITRAETMPIQRVAIQNENSPRQIEAETTKTPQKVPETIQPQPATAPPQQTNFAAPGTSDESFVMVDSPAVDEKPQSQSQPQGKRNQMREKKSGQLKEKGSAHLKEKSSNQSKEKQSNGKSGTSLTSLKKALDLVARGAGSKEKGSQPSTVQTLLTKASEDGKKPPEPVAAVKTSTPETENPPSATGSEKQSDKTHRISEGEGRAYEGDKAANRQTIYRPFSGLLRQASVQQSGSADGGSKRSSVFDRRSTAADSGSGKSPNAFDRPFEELKPPPTRPVNYRYTILEPLLLVIPQEGVLHQEPQGLIRLRQAMESIPDDFSFIHKTVLAWDAEAKKARERFERERHTRQTDNESRIDSLFNDKEIGYGDISQLEGEFKRQEAAKKAEEDRDEVGTFVTGVFDVVWARINYEMDQLTPLYDECVNLVSNASAGRGMFEDTEERVPIAPAMEILLILYQKLMVRHQKAFEAVLERDRRLKKTEVAPWYALGSIEKVKRIERRFEDAEKKAILEFCRQRDERANLLMDVLDQNTLRGVGANQDYMESIMQAVRKIANEVHINNIEKTEKGGSIRDDDIVSVDEVLKAKTITTALARSSEQIVSTFHVADMLLNAADYEVSVANAKLSNADAAAFKRLREAKAKEDNKLAMDLEHRMSLIRGDTQRTQEEIAKLLSLIRKKDSIGGGTPLDEEGRRDSGGSIGTPGAGQGGQNTPLDREKDARMQRALEEAKRRHGRKGG